MSDYGPWRSAFDKDAGAFLDILRTKLWPSPDKAPAKVGAPTTRILRIADAHDY